MDTQVLFGSFFSKFLAMLANYL